MYFLLCIKDCFSRKVKGKRDSHSNLSITKGHDRPFASPCPFATFRTTTSWCLAESLILAGLETNNGVCFACSECQDAQTGLGAQWTNGGCERSGWVPGGLVEGSQMLVSLC